MDETKRRIDDYTIDQVCGGYHVKGPNVDKIVPSGDLELYGHVLVAHFNKIFQANNDILAELKIVRNDMEMIKSELRAVQADIEITKKEVTSIYNKIN